MASTSDIALKAEIARLTGAINQHKTQQHHFLPRLAPQALASTRDVVIDGVTFQSSSRSLVRKDLPKPPTAPKAPLKPIPQPTDFSRTAHGHRIPSHRAYKPKVSSHKSRNRQQRPRNRNMTLNNTRRPTQSVHSHNSFRDSHLIPHRSNRKPNKRMRYLNKPCPRFTTTGASAIDSSNVPSSTRALVHGCSGACSRGLTCMYQHDPNKIAICWNFLHGHCPNTAESCNLSHDPIPERTPLCVHFANNGRCTREKCPFPHVRVGQRHGVCRNFAVLGYCSQGLDCDMQHVRECPDFAEKGTCSTKGCKLPHVIRANRNRKAPASTKGAKEGSHPVPSENAATPTAISGSNGISNNTLNSQQTSVQDAQLGDEYISLMFNESEESDDDSDDDDTDAENEGASEEEEGDDPTQQDGPSTDP